MEKVIAAFAIGVPRTDAGHHQIATRYEQAGNARADDAGATDNEYAHGFSFSFDSFFMEASSRPDV
jgi:hypothetical protein